MAKKSTAKNILKSQNLPQGIVIVVIVGIVVGLILANIFGGEQTQQQGAPQATPTPGAEEIQGREESQFTPPVELPTSHKVTTGESLVDLSVKYYGENSFWAGIAKKNGLEKPSLIEPETEINIPKKEEVQGVKIADLRTTGEDKITGNTYTVDYGDTLFKIAQRAYGDGSKWTLIDQANNLGRLPNGNPLIHAGNVLVIPR